MDSAKLEAAEPLPGIAMGDEAKSDVEAGRTGGAAREMGEEAAGDAGAGDDVLSFTGCARGWGGAPVDTGRIKHNCENYLGQNQTMKHKNGMNITCALTLEASRAHPVGLGGAAMHGTRSAR